MLKEEPINTSHIDPTKCSQCNTGKYITFISGITCCNICGWCPHLKTYIMGSNIPSTNVNTNNSNYL